MESMGSMDLGRRRAIGAMASAAAWLAVERCLDPVAVALAQEPRLNGGRLVRRVPLGRLDGRPVPPFHQLLGSGLDARQFTDLSTLAPDRLVTPTGEFYIRTATPASLPPAGSWRIELGGLARAAASLPLERLHAEARPMGVHLLECSGNADPANFGLLSAASWQGVPIGWALDRLQPAARDVRIKITGLDDVGQSRTSVPGAAWVFTRDELEARSAFLATAMNDAPLTPDHGAPVRLVVPNYYGCSAIKWVTRIDAVPDDEPSTTQMREFSARTHQDGVPPLARAFEPPAIDLAATPVRIEEWAVPDGRGGDRRVYRVVGIRWGGTSPKAPLTIRFNHREPFVPVDDCPDAASTTTWSLWSHLWSPPGPGRYRIALGVSDRSIRTRRLDVFYYAREIEIA